jgi:hypothetical protein
MEWSYQKEQLIFGSGYGIFFDPLLRVLDGFSSEWVLLPQMIIANASGTALFV